jgi:hypothetical protein
MATCLPHARVPQWQAGRSPGCRGTGRNLPLAGQEPDGGCAVGNRFANDSNAVAMSTSAQKRW